MKKIIISWLFCLATVSVCGQDVCRYFRGEKICDKVSATRILVKTETLDIAGLENVLRNPVAGSLKNIYDMGDLFLIEMENTGREDMWALQRQLSAWEDVIYASPVFGNYPGTGYTNEVLVTLKSKDDYPVLQEYAEAYHLEDITASAYLPPEIYLLILPHNPEKDAAEIALELYETGLFLSADPNLIHLCAFEWCPYGPESDPDMNAILEEKQGIVYYPNPVSDILYINLEKHDRDKTSAFYEIRLYNSMGNMCRQAKAPGGIVELSVLDLPDGIYLLTVYDGSTSKPETHKIIVKH
jgi:hypothetical protein